MNLNNLLKYFIPKEKKFYGMFVQAADNCIKASAELVILFNSTTQEERKVIRQRIKAIEKQGDEITNHIFDELNTTFITPFDREDIHELTNKIDDVVDLIYSLSGKVEFYQCKSFSSYMVEMTKLINEGCNQLHLAVSGLENMKNAKISLQACRSLRKTESAVDELYHQAISNLFENENNAIELIKQKEIIQNIEKIANKMEDVSDVVKTILVKYA